MAIQIPTEEELAKRIREHLAARPESCDVAVAWRGYLASLIEWGLLQPGVYGRLSNLLPKMIGIEEISEIMLGPDYKDVQKELAEQAKRSADNRQGQVAAHRAIAETERT